MTSTLQPDTPTAASSGSIQVRQLSRRFGQKLALAPIDLDIQPGAVTGLLGPNGSGKSTLMRCLIGLVRKDSGEVTIDGVPLEGDGLELRRRCTFAPGEFSLYGRMKAKDQLDWLAAGRGSEALERSRKIADDLELPLNMRVRTFSHGMKRQLIFAAALGPRVPVRLLDEISEGLDPAKRGTVLEMLREDAKAGATILLSSHHLSEVQRVCHRMIFMRGGLKLSDERSEDVMDKARRLVRLRFEPGSDFAELERAALRCGALSVSGDAQNLLMQLAEDNPRPTLAKFFAGDGQPRLLSLEYGEPSLEDLYRNLYGEEAC